MKLFGYKCGNENLLDLEEISIQCDLDELEKLIQFFTQVKKEHSSVIGKTNMCHSHLKDWDKTWTNDKPDVIVVTKFTD